MSLGRPDGQFGPEFSTRSAKKGSPVVPGSTQKILEEGDMLLFTVTILKGHYQARIPVALKGHGCGGGTGVRVSAEKHVMI